jgi:hypothetical protein
MVAAMALRTGIYIVPTHRWYIERTVWLIAGFVLLTSTALAALVHPLWILVVIATGAASVTVALTGFCIVGNVGDPAVERSIQLSSGGAMGGTRLELVTSTMSTWRSNQLS